ncbi:MAG TPA: hypothetical protein VLI05_05465 [Candidatus Saccharimonadia bacterium]|nr:hypothetical protein [Candidatus Saccharimonadia bacterium]
MNSSREVLRAHYARVLRKAAAWLAVTSIAVTAVIIPTTAQAAQLSSRKATLSDSASSSTTDNVTFSFTFGSSYTVKGIKFQVCNSPLQSVSCTVPTGATFNNASTTLGSTTGSCASFAYSSKSATDYNITFSTGNAVTSASTCTAVVNGLTNPSTANLEFYLRITTFTDTAMTLPTANGQDFGGIAESTTQVMSVTANVQEDLTFCVGATGTTCANITGSTVTLAPNPMTTSSASKGAAVMAASTNATSGYVITYNATSFTDTTSDTITAAPSGGAALGAGGSEQFGFNLAANSGGNFGTFGAGPSGGSGSVTAPYATNNQIAYNTAGATQVASAAGPTALTLFTMSFGANVAITTKAGAYTATQTFIATGTF